MYSHCMNEVSMDDSIAGIRAKLAALPPAEKAVLGPVLTERQVTDFERLRGARLPEEFRQFVTRVGHGGYGPGVELLPVERWMSPRTEIRGRLADPFPFVPDTHISAWSGDGEGQSLPFPGAIAVAWCGGVQYTLLVVTGPGRGRLVEVFAGTDVEPHFHNDANFLAWYERWLDLVLAGHRDLLWFEWQMAGDETHLVDTLLTEPLATRRNAAAHTFITYPGPSGSLPDVLTRALTTEPHPLVRRTILLALEAQGDAGREHLSMALADPVPEIRKFAARLMATETPQGPRLGPACRHFLTDHLRAEKDPSVRFTVEWLLRLSDTP